MPVPAGKLPLSQESRTSLLCALYAKKAMPPKGLEAMAAIGELLKSDRSDKSDEPLPPSPSPPQQQPQQQQQQQQPPVQQDGRGGQGSVHLEPEGRHEPDADQRRGQLHGHQAERPIQRVVQDYLRALDGKVAEAAPSAVAPAPASAAHRDGASAAAHRDGAANEQATPGGSEPDTSAGRWHTANLRLPLLAPHVQVGLFDLIFFSSGLIVHIRCTFSGVRIGFVSSLAGQHSGLYPVPATPVPATPVTPVFILSLPHPCAESVQKAMWPGQPW